METWQVVVLTLYVIGFFVSGFLFLLDIVPDTFYMNMSSETTKGAYAFFCSLFWPFYLAFFIFVVLFVLGDF